MFWISMVLMVLMPLGLKADDTEIYGTVTTTGIEPNVLINQKHPEFGSISASDPAPAVLDPRLLAAG